MGRSYIETNALAFKFARMRRTHRCVLTVTSVPQTADPHLGLQTLHLEVQTLHFATALMYCVQGSNDVSATDRRSV